MSLSAGSGPASSHDLLAQALAIAHIGAWDWDVVTGSVSWTDEHYRIFGLDPADLVPSIDAVMGFVHEEDRADFAMMLDESTACRASCSTVVRIRRPDGRVRWIESIGVPSVVDGEVVRLVGTVVDVTERHEREAQYRSVVESACGAIVVDTKGIATFDERQAVGSWAYDVATRLLSCSEDVYAITGIEHRSELASIEQLVALAHGEDRGRATALFERLGASPTAAFDEVRIVTPAGAERWVEFRATSVGDLSGQVCEVHGTVQDVTERKASERQLVRLALHDTLTGLPNRSLFNDRLQHALSLRGSAVAVLLVDLDGFKAVNDGLGHAAGDALLVAVAERLALSLRRCDTVARFGGDEFTVLLEGAEEAEATIAVQRMLDAFVEPIEIEGRHVVAQMSIGVTLGSHGAASPSELLRHADAAMYAAKRKGGGRYEIFSEELHQAEVERLALECDLRSVALGTEMTLDYQPIVDLGNGCITGFEALLRWNHPRLGLLSPDSYMAIAEETGAIIPIGRWVVEEACRQARSCQACHPAAAGLTMSVNLSAHQLAHPDIAAVVARALERSGFDSALLTLEVTETMIMAEGGEVEKTLRAFKELGVRISIDDFGTGFSSLSHLDRFPIDELKIDRSFVDRLGTGDEDHGVAMAVIGLAQSLQVDVVAEGIERDDQLVQLRRSSCTRGQGWYFWKPLDVASAGELLGSQATPAVPTKEIAPVVLVVDDEIEVRRSTARVFTDAGYDVVEAGTGREAVEAVRRGGLDAVILDIGLPDISGFEVCRIIRELVHDELAVVHLSGTAATVDDRVRGLDLGADAYLVKPVAPAELVATLGSLLRGTRSPGASRARRPQVAVSGTYAVG